MSDVERRIDAHIKKFVRDLNHLVREAAVQVVANALGTSAGSARRGRASSATGRASKRKTHRIRKGGRRSPVELNKTRKALAEFVAANPGELMENIAKALDSTSRELARPMSKLLAEGAVRRDGEKRASRYYPGKAGRAGKKTARRASRKSATKRTPKRTSKKKRATRRAA